MRKPILQKPDGQTLFLGSVAAIGVLVVAYMTLLHDNADAPAQNPAAGTRADNPINGQRAYQWLERICDLGPRPSGSDGMARQQQMLADHFKKLGGSTFFQQFDHPHPLTGEDVTLGNLIVHWHPDRRERVLLCAHYDTRPYPDRDPDRTRRRGIFVGANDGASGTAVLAELANHMRFLDRPYGVDFVLFDAEELVYNERGDKYFLGSEYFSRQYRENPPDYRYRFAVLLDMVGDRDLQIYQERNSMSTPATRQLVHDIWSTAARLGVDEFIPRPRHKIDDDHKMLMEVGRIPACDIIDFDYPRLGARSYWHTEADTADKCSAESLAKVGWVVYEWLKRLR